MPYEFHTILPVQNSDGSADRVWVQAELVWDQNIGVPHIESFMCDDPDVMDFWHSEEAPSLSMAIIDDAIRLHNAFSEMQ